MISPMHPQVAGLFGFVGGADGDWEVTGSDAVAGPGLPGVARLAVVDGPAITSVEHSWVLWGATSSIRYTERRERDALAARQAPLGRVQATRAALIPIRKSAAWWELAQDERRAILEEQAHHIEIGLRYLPAIARRLHHSRDLAEPFDFLTWFEFAPADANAFDELVGLLRDSAEWDYVEREVDIRLGRD